MAGFLIKIQRLMNKHSRIVWLAIILTFCLFLYVATNNGIIAKPSPKYQYEPKSEDKKEEVNRKGHRKRNKLPEGWKHHFYSERDQDLWEDLESDFDGDKPPKRKIDLISILKIKSRDNKMDYNQARQAKLGKLGQAGEKHPEVRIRDSAMDIHAGRVGPRIFIEGRDAPMGKAAFVDGQPRPDTENMEKQPKVIQPGVIQPPQPGNRVIPAAVGIPGVHGDPDDNKRVATDKEFLRFPKF